MSFLLIMFINTLLDGRVVDLNGQPIEGASVIFANQKIETDHLGRFQFPPNWVGQTIVIEKSGFSRTSITLDDEKELKVVLEPDLSLMETMVVAPSQYSLMQREAAQSSYLTKSQIQNMPKFGDDIYRVVAQMPGAQSQGFSAKFWVRGGLENETRVVIDGMEIDEPFHLKDYGSVFSIIDPEIIGRMDLMTGGFQAQFGEKMSAVLDFQSVNPTQKRTLFGVSFSNAFLSTEGTFADGLGQYVFSLRRGYLDILLDLAGAQDDDDDQTMKLPYLDSFGKVQYALGDHSTLSFNFLLSDDELDLVERDNDSPGEVKTSYGSQYGWVGMKTFWSNSLYSHTLLYHGNLDRDRVSNAQDWFNAEEGSIVEDNDYIVSGIKQDWEWTIHKKALFKAGFQFKKHDVDYRYRGEYENPYPILGPAFRGHDLAFNKEGESIHAYASQRFQIGEKVVAEVGLRFDDYEYLSDNILSPRFNLAFQATPNTTWRFAVGRFAQAQGIQELQVSDGVTEFGDISYSDQVLLSLDHAFSANLDFQIEAYHKDIQDLNPRYETIFAYFDPFPEWRDDRLLLNVASAEAYGVDLVLKQTVNPKLSWFLNYSYAVAEEDIDGQKVHRRFGGPHVVKANLNYRRNKKWNWHFNWQYASGRRSTSIRFVEKEIADGGFPYRAELGHLYDESFDPYHALNMRLTRHLTKPNNRGLSFFLDISNLYNREVPLGLEYEVIEGNQLFLEVDEVETLPIMPSLGFNYAF